jgi:hypothetical protein
MSNGAKAPDSNPVALYAAYVESLRIHALTLIALGYARMNRAMFATAEEDTITGELTKEMKVAMEEETSPDWTQHYSVAEQVRVNTADKEGKGRPIVDIEFERHKQGRRPRFRFEAKRLGPNHNAANYFGDGGLEAFVTGYYDRTHEDAGMLGYVQSLNETEWATRLSNEANQRTSLLGITDAWSAFSHSECPPHTFQTRHQDQAGADLNVFHVLLGFLN